jgi:hypothetical protein
MVTATRIGRMLARRREELGRQRGGGRRAEDRGQKTVDSSQ